MGTKIKTLINMVMGGFNEPIVQFVFTALFWGLAFWFFKHEKVEFAQVKHTLFHANWWWVLAGLINTALYIILQGSMYVSSFASIQCRFGLLDSIILFLERNFISVFLPAGGVSSLAFFTGSAEKKGITRTQVYFASAIYGYCGILSIIVVGIPFLFFVIAVRGHVYGILPAIGLLILLLVLFPLFFQSFFKKGVLYHFLQKFFPTLSVFLEEIQTQKISNKHFLRTLFFSVLIELTGVIHVYIAMLALGFQPDLYMATMAYLVSVLVLVLSPFLRGLGAIEMSMSIVLVQAGLSNVEAISITLLYRFFEFWTPLAAGIASFIYKANKLLTRVLPALGTLVIGLVNIVSVLTPEIPERMGQLRQLIPIDVIHASNIFVLIFGFFLIALSAFLLKGLRSAWWITLFLMIGSIIGHITKGIDYEEAAAAFLIGCMLIFSRRQYNVKVDARLRNIGIQTALIVVGFVFIYGIIGFYFINKSHFEGEFNLKQSLAYTFLNFLLIGSKDLHPETHFAKAFLLSIQICGGFTLSFLFYTLIRPFLLDKTPSDEELERASQLVKRFGRSSLDYFKTYSDKLLFVPEGVNAFLAFKVGGNYAVVLENPVSENDDQVKNCIIKFSRFCYANGLKEIYYRVPEEDLGIYHSLKKKSLLIGEQGVVDLSTFALEGGTMKSVRNAIRKVKDLGYNIKIYEPPQKDGLLQKIKSVSQEWLEFSGHNEIAFSQGIFNPQEIKQQTVITVENTEEKVVAFANIIPDYKKDEGTFDIIRKTNDSPNGVIDFLMIGIFDYFKQKNTRYVDIGFAPLSGLGQSKKLPETTLKFAYNNIRSFSHYKGQHEYKDKFKPAWTRRYLVYSNDFDLLQMPVVLKKVIQP